MRNRQLEILIYNFIHTNPGCNYKELYDGIIDELPPMMPYYDKTGRRDNICYIRIRDELLGMINEDFSIIYKYLDNPQIITNSTFYIRDHSEAELLRNTDG
jgi:hypothetical protein